MQDSEENKEKLLSILKNRANTDEKIGEKVETNENNVSIANKVVNSPTPVKSLNFLFWIVFIAVDILVAFIIYVFWL